jgi:hypothetical protein
MNEELTAAFLPLDYVMGKKVCPHLEHIDKFAYDIMQAYGEYFRACKIAQITLNNKLIDVLGVLYKEEEHPPIKKEPPEAFLNEPIF